MHNPKKDELADCRALASEIVTALRTGGWNIPTAPVERGSRLSRFANFSITLSAEPGAYNDVSLITGSSAIRIGLPNQRFVASRVSDAECAAIERVVFGILAHEVTHLIQQAAAPEAYAVAVALESRLRTLSPPVSVQDNFGLYIGQPFEQEARAVQAAAEVHALGGSALPRADFDKHLPQTEVFRRTASKIGAKGTGSQIIINWWEMWSALAWDAYSRW